MMVVLMDILFVVVFYRSRQIITPCGRGVDMGRIIYIYIYIYVLKLTRNGSIETRDPSEELQQLQYRVPIL